MSEPVSGYSIGTEIGNHEDVSDSFHPRHIQLTLTICFGCIREWWRIIIIIITIILMLMRGAWFATLASQFNYVDRPYSFRGSANWAVSNSVWQFEMVLFVDKVLETRKFPGPPDKWTDSFTRTKENSAKYFPSETSKNVPSCSFQISWIRLRDWHILTNGVQTYTSDDRFSILHKEGSFDWILQIKYVQERDAGVYECQVRDLLIK